MLTLIAQSAPETIKPWLENFFWLAGGIAAVLGCFVAVQSLREPPAESPPQPFEVKPHTAYATKEDLKLAHGRIARERGEVDAAIAELRADLRASTDKLANSVNALRLEIKADNQGVHTRINEVLAAVSKLQGMVQK